MKAHLLYEEQDFDFAAELPAHHKDLISDLELNTLLAAMSQGDKFLHDVSARVLLTSLTNLNAIRFRQQILADCLAEPDVIRAMYDIAVGALADKRKVWGYFSTNSPASTLHAAVSQLEVLIARLRQLRSVADEHAGKFRSAGLAALFAGLGRDLDDGYFELLNRHLKQLRFRGGELLSVELGKDNGGTGYVLRSGVARRSLKERVGLAPKTVYSFTLAPRDEAGAETLAAMTNRGLNQVANAAAQSADHVSSYFSMLRAELGFYVCCLNLNDQLTARNQPVTLPVPADPDSGDLACADLRDACLTLRAGDAIGNDVNADGKSLVIVTGANSGGKSTFLRSVGLAQLMMQCGLFVVARSFKASVRTGIFTHFIREEDRDMISGRLDEELRRLSSIAEDLKPGALMLFNESFAATNEREGSEIARQVVAAMLESGVRVLFVTHQFDFADSFHRRQLGTALFLRAPRQPDGQRNYKLIAAEPLPTSFGGDIYHRIGGWN